ncbi:MAG: hypothetical protein HQK76_00205 [Desulfobacterales bacterium]|nr:hypothetical protein [Desulfobacterales bacterium]
MKKIFSIIIILFIVLFCFKQQAFSSDIVLHGWGKIRLDDVSASKEDISGLYGEDLKETTSVNHRFFLEGATAINPNFQVGALLRLSSEEDEVLLNGPVYLKSPYGSIFARFTNDWFDARVGYYDVYFTPLTLMRFDKKDLPELGGSTGCSSCSSRGGLIGGSLLEDVDEKLTFEGGKINSFLSDNFETTILYARSQKSVESERYKRHTIGVRALYRNYIKTSKDDFIVSFQYLYHDDEGCSVESLPDYSPLQNHVGSIYLFYPALRSVTLFGEFAISKLTQKLICVSNPITDEHSGNAFTTGLNIIWPNGFNSQLAYLYRSNDFDSLYSALTYTQNRKGGRISSSWTRQDDMLSIDFFVKYLEEVEQEIKGDAEFFLSLSAGISFIPEKNVTIRLRGLWDKQKRDAENKALDKDILIYSGTVQASYEIAKNNYLEIKYQYMNNKDANDKTNEFDAHVVTTELNIKF